MAAAARCSATNLACPPCNVGPRSIPDYASLAEAAIHTLDSGEVVFAGQRHEGFYVDLGSIFDLGDLRPFQNLHLIPTPTRPASTRTAGRTCTRSRSRCRSGSSRGTAPSPTDPADAEVGDRRLGHGEPAQVASCATPTGDVMDVGPWVQVSRLGNPLFNEVIVPMAQQGHVERAAARERQRSSRSTSRSPSWRSCCRCCTRACSRTWPGCTPTGPTWWRSC